MIIVKYIQEFLWSCCGQCGVSSVSDCSSFQLALFLMVLGPLQYLVSVDYRVLICCSCHFQSGSLFFILTSSVCKSLQCLISALTKGYKGGHFFKLIFSVVLWGGRDPANKYRWCMQGVLTVYGPHWVCPSSRWHVLPRSTLLRLQGALRGTVQSRPCPSCTSEVQAAQVLRSSARAQIWLGTRFVPFPAPRSLGDQVLCECTVLAGPSALLTSPRAARFPWCAVCLLWGPELRLQPSWQMSAIQDPRKT